MIYIARHGQTSWNLQGRKQGRKDSPLTLKGFSQARNVAEILNHNIESYDKFKIVVSPQWRCQQFASIICEISGLKFSDCILEEDLRERCFGLWGGKNEEEIEKQFPGFLQKRYKPENYWSYIVPMGESYELLYNRVSQIVDKYSGENIIYICHEMVSKVMRGYILDLQPKEILPLKHPQDIVYKISNKKILELRSGI